MHTDPLIGNFYHACTRGDIDDIKKTFEALPDTILVGYLFETATCYLSLADSPEGLDYFFKQISDPTIHDYLMMMINNIESVCYHRKKQTLQYWLEETPIKDIVDKETSKNIFLRLVIGAQTSAQLGDLDILEYITENTHFKQHIKGNKVINSLLGSAAKNDQLTVVERLMEKYGSSTPILLNSLLKEAAINNAYQIMDYLLHTINIPYSEKTKKYFSNNKKITDMFIQRDSKRKFYNGLEQDLIKNEDTIKNSVKNTKLKV